MQVPTTVSFKGIPTSESVRDVCLGEAEKLERFYDRITSCQVTVSLPQRHRKGNHFDVHVRVGLPGGELHVDRAPTDRRADEAPEAAVRAAFDDMRRQLLDHVDKLRGDVKQHERHA